MKEKIKIKKTTNTINFLRGDKGISSSEMRGCLSPTNEISKAHTNHPTQKKTPMKTKKERKIGANFLDFAPKKA